MPIPRRLGYICRARAKYWYPEIWFRNARLVTSKLFVGSRATWSKYVVLWVDSPSGRECTFRVFARWNTCFFLEETLCNPTDWHSFPIKLSKRRPKNNQTSTRRRCKKQNKKRLVRKQNEKKWRRNTVNASKLKWGRNGNKNFRLSTCNL